MTDLARPSKPDDLYAIRPGMRGKTCEWGRFVVLRVRSGRVTFRASGSRGAPGSFTTTRSILFAQANWL